jgi:hypothetical protein
MIIATAGPATCAAWTASKLPETAAGPGVDCPLWAAEPGEALGLFLFSELEVEERGFETDTLQAEAMSRAPSTDSSKAPGAPVLASLPGIPVLIATCPHGISAHVKVS